MIGSTREIAGRPRSSEGIAVAQARKRGDRARIERIQVERGCWSSWLVLRERKEDGAEKAGCCKLNHYE